MELYATFGLTIRSEMPLPLARAGAAARGVEVLVRSSSLDAELAELRREEREYSVLPGEARFYWSDIGGFVARNGNEILVDPAPGASAADIELGVLGPALVTILYQRGFVLLHGSVVDVGGVTVAFLGRSGWGKSTIAAALVARGHALLADDVAAIRLDDSRALVYPGMPQFRLWPDAAAAVGARADDLAELAPGYGKRVLASDERSSSHPARLERVYVLALGDAIAVERLPARQAFLELTNHSLAARWFLSSSHVTQFGQRARLAQRVPLSRLRRPRDLGRLADVAAAVEQDVAHV